MRAVQVAVRDEDHGVVVIDFLDDSRNRIIQLPRDHVPSLTGEDFQTAFGVDSGKYRVFHAVQFDRLFQLLVIVAGHIDRNSVELGFFQIRRVERNEVRFAVLRDGQVLHCLFVRGHQPLVKNLCDFRTGRPQRSRTGHERRGRFDLCGLFHWRRLFGRRFAVCIRFFRRRSRFRFFLRLLRFQCRCGFYLSWLLRRLLRHIRFLAA